MYMDIEKKTLQTRGELACHTHTTMSTTAPASTTEHAAAPADAMLESLPQPVKTVLTYADMLNDEQKKQATTALLCVASFLLL